MNRLSTAHRARIIGCLVEGNSLRVTARMTGTAFNTVLKLLPEIGEACRDYQDKVLRDLDFPGLFQVIPAPPVTNRLCCRRLLEVRYGAWIRSGASTDVWRARGDSEAAFEESPLIFRKHFPGIVEPSKALKNLDAAVQSQLPALRLQ